MGMKSSALFMRVEVSPGTGCVLTRESGVTGDAGSCQGTTGEANLTRVVTSSISIDPSESELLPVGWQGTEAWFTLGSTVGEETAVGKMG